MEEPRRNQEGTRSSKLNGRPGRICNMQGCSCKHTFSLIFCLRIPPSIRQPPEHQLTCAALRMTHKCALILNLCALYSSAGSDSAFGHRHFFALAAKVKLKQPCWQLTRERIDSLSDVMRTLAIARQAHSERMEALERKVQLNEETTNRKLEELEVASKRRVGRKEEADRIRRPKAGCIGDGVWNTSGFWNRYLNVCCLNCCLSSLGCCSCSINVIPTEMNNPITPGFGYLSLQQNEKARLQKTFGTHSIRNLAKSVPWRLSPKWASHDVGILSNARKLTELGVGLSVARVDIESLRDRMTQAAFEPLLCTMYMRGASMAMCWRTCISE
eukprot:1149498-Pelagomonas_calceolata.AAC.11